MTRNLRINLLAGLALLVIPHLVYHHVFTTIFGNDFVSQPNLLLRWIYYLKSGVFPFWSPLSHGGMTIAYETAVSGAFSPINWILAGLPSVMRGEIIKPLLHIKFVLMSFGGFFAYLYFKKISGSSRGAFLGAVAFILNTRMLDALRYATPVDAICLLPAIVWSLELILRGEKPRFQPWFAIGIGLMFLSGQPQYGVFIMLFVGAYFIAGNLRIRFVLHKEMAITNKIRWSKFIIYSGLGLMLAAPLLIPFAMDAMPEMGTRVSESAAWRDQYHMNPFSMVMNFGLPWFAEVHSGFYASFFACLMLLGSVALVFQKSVFSKAEQFHLKFFILCLILCLMYSLGSSVFINAWIQEVIFILKFTRNPGRIMILGIFCIGAIVSLTFKALFESNGMSRKKALSFIGLSAVMMLGPIAWLMITGISTAEPYAPVNILQDPTMFGNQIFYFAIFGILSCGLCCFLLRFRNSRKFNMGFVALILLILIEVMLYHPKGTWYANYQLSDLKTHSYEIFSKADTLQGRNPMLSDPGFNSPILMPGKKPNPDAPRRISDFLLHAGINGGMLWLSEGESRLYYTNQYRFTENALDALEQIKNQGMRINLREITLIDRSEEPKFSPDFIHHRIRPEPLEASIQVIERNPNSILFEIIAPEPGIVNYLDNFHPQFKATLNGETVPIIKTNGTFKGVAIPSGKHRVRIEYDPIHYMLGFLVALLALLVWVVAWKRSR